MLTFRILLLWFFLSKSKREKTCSKKWHFCAVFIKKNVFLLFKCNMEKQFYCFFLDDILFQSQETLERLFAYSILENWRWFTFQSFAPPTRYVLLLVILQITVYNKFTKTCFVERRIRSWSWQAFVLHRLPVHFKIWHMLTTSVTHSWPPI